MSMLKRIGIGLGISALALCVAVGVGSFLTERDIAAFQDRVETIADGHNRSFTEPNDISALPTPVQRYFDYVFPEGIPEASHVFLRASGQFRRPQTETFNLTTSEQVIAIGNPALMFSATTPVMPGVWARAYDFFADGEMEMKAKILSLVTVVDEKETPELNVISLRRWLLESALCPHALLPGGPVMWESIDATRARAVVTIDGMTAAMVAHFDADGRMTLMQAEDDGDLSTPYHGSGEHVTRTDYRDVNGVRIPHRFVISRANNGEIYPFYDAQITEIRFQ